MAKRDELKDQMEQEGIEVTPGIRQLGGIPHPLIQERYDEARKASRPTKEQKAFIAQVEGQAEVGNMPFPTAASADAASGPGIDAVSADEAAVTAATARAARPSRTTS